MRAGADDRHRPRAVQRQELAGERRGRGGAQRRQDGHLRDQHRIAAVDMRQHAESSHGLEPLSHVLRMAVDIFEAVGRAVAGRHQFDDALGRMGDDPGRLVEKLPANEVLLDIGGEFRNHPLDADIPHDPHHVVDADEGNEAQESRLGRAHAGFSSWVWRRPGDDNPPPFLRPNDTPGRGASNSRTLTLPSPLRL